MPAKGFIKYFFRFYLLSLFALLGFALWRFRDGVSARDLHDPASLAVMVGILVGLIGLPLVGSVYLSYRTRTRAILRPAPQQAAAHQFPAQVAEFPLPELREMAARRLRSSYLAVLCLTIVISGIFIHAFSPAITAGPATPSAPLLAALLGVIGFVIAMALIVTYVSTSNERKALRLTRGRQLSLRIDESGLRVPLFLLTEPAFFRTVEAGLDHLTISWQDVTGWSVEAAVGRARPQFVLSVRGAAEAFGTGLLGIAPGGGPRIGILRQPIAEQEGRILGLVRQHLHCPIRINDERVPLP